jgi:5-deoxy-glucuronate isomerase
MNVFFKASTSEGITEIVNPQNSDSDGLELALIRALPGRPMDAVSPGRESLLVILGGHCSVAVTDMAAWDDLGERGTVFEGAATSVYVPAGIPHRISARREAEIAVLRAPAAAGGKTYVIRPSEVTVATRGTGAWQRTVHTILDESRPAQRLVVGETFNEPGAWSSYPPHKHDRHDPPREVRFQEVYHFRVTPRGGFGIQRLYAPEPQVDSTFVVEDGDTVLIPFGYHPVVAAPGYRLYYLWALVGEGRHLAAREDPAHAWVGRGPTRNP